MARPRKSATLGALCILVALAIVLFCSAFVALFLGNVTIGYLVVHYVILVVGGGFSIVIALPSAGRWLRRARRYWARSGETVLLADPRPPVLYLRPFGEEETILHEASERGQLTIEERLCRGFRYLGPPIALGQPDDNLPLIGAARLYVDKEWQSTVSTLMARSALIIFQVGSKAYDSLLWELISAVNQQPFKPLLLVFPYDFGGIYSRRERYLNFKDLVKRKIGLELPEFLDDTNYIFIPSSGRAELLRTGKGASVDPIELVLPSIDPSAYSRYYTARRRWAFLGRPALVMAVFIWIAWLAGEVSAGNQPDEAHTRVEKSLCGPLYNLVRERKETQAACLARIDAEVQDLIEAMAASRFMAKYTSTFAMAVMVLCMILYVASRERPAKEVRLVESYRRGAGTRK